jgi:uncharacterized membrane protein YeaQ/YmgE (transglycosylase-associated protein family)
VVVATVSPRVEAWNAWPVSWTGIWVGVLAALATGLVIGLIGTAVGAHQLAEGRATRPGELRMLALIFSVVGAFFSTVVGGWVAVRVAGILRAESAMLHGAIVWMLGIPILLVLAALGATSYLGAWYGGFGPAARSMTDAIAARNSALGGLTALLIGLVGGVIGGWMASGEPMTLAGRRRLDTETIRRRDIAA